MASNKVPAIVVPCSICGQTFTLPTSKRAYWKRTGRAICSPECFKGSYAGRDIGPKEAGKVRLAALRRVQNPMSNPASRAKMSGTLRAMRHRPKVRGGNGQGPTEAQKALADALGWPMEVIVPTGQREAGGPPTHWKLDIANPELMIAVEVDGFSHGLLARQAADARKVAWLNGAGWTVFRFSNQEVMADTAACVRTVMSTTSR